MTREVMGVKTEKLDYIRISIQRTPGGASVDFSTEFKEGNTCYRNSFTRVFKTFDEAMELTAKLCSGIPDMMKGGEV